MVVSAVCSGWHPGRKRILGKQGEKECQSQYPFRIEKYLSCLRFFRAKKWGPFWAELTQKDPCWSFFFGRFLAPRNSACSLMQQAPRFSPCSPHVRKVPTNVSNYTHLKFTQRAKWCRQRRSKLETADFLHFSVLPEDAKEPSERKSLCVCVRSSFLSLSSPPLLVPFVAGHL